MIMDIRRLARIFISCDNIITNRSGATHMLGHTCANAPPLETKVQFLSRASSYPHRPDHVLVKETHMSWVFLAGERVFKLKKPVRYSYLDFTTLEARERYCREETRLNRRLAPGVYRGVVPLTCSASGEMTLGGEGEIVEWTIEMQRLPADRMLDVRLKEGRVGEEDVSRLAQVLANFYRHAERPAIDPDMPFRHFTQEIAENRTVLLCSGLWPDQSRVSALLDRLDAALRRIRPRLRERAQSGCIVDGHGDLRPEHVCLTDPIVIFDCLEFNRDLRLVDPYDELTFLGMECAHLNAAWFGRALIERVAGIMGDAIPHDLLGTYTALHAVLRARLSLAHLLDPVPREPQKWAPQARQYLDLAEHALASLP
jgi:aminoglycoside phosphotransferase family enzyme